MNSQHLLLLAACGLLAAGCSASPTYACGSPQGGKCQSVTQAYLAALGKRLKGGSQDTASNGQPDAARVTQYIPAGVAIRSLPQVMRVWIAPWEDSNGVFHDQSYNYFVADSGEWTLRANTARSIYANGYQALERPTEKQPAASADSKVGDAGKPAAAITQADAQAQAFDFMQGD